MTQPLRIVELLVLLCAVAGVFPLYPHLELFPKLLLPLSAIAGIVASRRGIRVPSLLLTFVSIVLFVYYLARFGHNSIVVPASNLLAALLAVRLAGERNSRIFLQICALSIFCLASSTLFTLGPAFLFSLLLLSIIVISALIILTFHETDPTITLSRFEIHSLARLILLTTITTLPLMLLFFVILPRTQFPLWNAFAPKGEAVSGISDRVEPGRSEKIEESNDVAFRSVMQSVDANDLYWRCVVFNRYSSGAWIRTPLPATETGVAGRGKAIRQTILAEPGRFKYLPALDQPVQINAFRTSTSGDQVTSLSGSGANRTKYDVLSIPGDTLKTRTVIDRDFYLHLPTELPPRLAAAALNIGASGKTDSEILSQAREFFASKRLKYSTKGLPTGKDNLDRFLFDEKQGHCEYFASSFALFMRAAGVPARVVGGYYGGVYNELGGYYAVSEEMAHAWTEVYLDGVGWKRVDPSLWSAGFADIGTMRGKGLAGQITTILDTFVYYWNVTVITYDLGTQLRIARNTGGMLQYENISRTLRRTAQWFIPLIAAAVCLYALPHISKRTGDGQLALKFIRLTGYESPPKGKGLLDIASEWRNPLADRFAFLYCHALYRDRALTQKERRELSSLFAALKELKSKG